MLDSFKENTKNTETYEDLHNRIWEDLKITETIPDLLICIIQHGNINQFIPYLERYKKESNGYFWKETINKCYFWAVVMNEESIIDYIKSHYENILDKKELTIIYSRKQRLNFNYQQQLDYLRD